MSNSLPRNVSDALFDIVDGLANEDLTRMDALCEINDVIEDCMGSYCELNETIYAKNKEIASQLCDIQKFKQAYEAVYYRNRELEKECESLKQEILGQKEEIERLKKLNSSSLQNDCD